jgi:TrmH family RNA methyltransferase
MGAAFSLRIWEYDDFLEYRAAFPLRTLYPFMLDGARELDTAVKRIVTPYTLIVGNEGSGLPASFQKEGLPVRIPHSEAIDSLNLSVAASIGMYAFKQNE